LNWRQIVDLFDALVANSLEKAAFLATLSKIAKGGPSHGPGQVGASQSLRLMRTHLDVPAGEPP
jgi:hypothetical protein